MTTLLQQIHFVCLMVFNFSYIVTRGSQFEPGWLNELGSRITQQPIQAYHQYRVGSCPAL